IEQRIVALPIVAAAIGNIETGEPGMLYYVRSADGTNVLRRYDMNKRTDVVFIPSFSGNYQLSADGKKILYAAQGSWFVTATATIDSPRRGRSRADSSARITPWPMAATGSRRSTAD